MRLYGECVYFALHQLSKCGIYHTVACNRIVTGKLRRNDVQHIMSASAASAGMARMLVTFINYFQGGRIEHGKTRAHLILDLIHWGNVFLNGCT